MKRFYQVSTPWLGKVEKKYVNIALKNNEISGFFGRYIPEFEKKFSKFCKSKYAVTVSSGTTALHLALVSLGIKKGDEVIVSTLTNMASIFAILYIGAKPIPIDIGDDTFNLDVNLIEKKITKKTKAIIATHIYNFPLRVDLLKKICKKKNIIIIEDAAEALGQKLNNKLCGSFGDISIFSFYANKQITTGEGGMITTNNKKIYEYCNSLRNLCFGKIDRFNHDGIGWNYRMTNIQASLGVSQLKRINTIVKKRHLVGRKYFNKLKNNKNIYIPETSRSYAKNIYWVIAILIVNKDLKINAKDLGKKLIEFGIQTRPFFWPMHKQRVLKKKINISANDNYKNSEYISNYGLYLPSSLDIKDEEIEFICDKVNFILQ